GVEVESIRSTLLPLISDLASWPARAGSDCVSLATIVTAYVVPPILRPLFSALRNAETTHGSASPNEPSGPVRGLRKPIRRVFASGAASWVTRIGRAAAAPATEPATIRPPAPTPAFLTISLRV